MSESTGSISINGGNNSRKRAKPQWREAVAGACSGAISRTIMAPIERIKLLQQLQHSTGSGHNNTLVVVIKTTYNNDIYQLSGFQIARKIYREEGMMSFWRGNLPNILRVAGTQALNFTCMDYYKRAAVIPMMEHLLPPSSSSSSTSSSAAPGQQKMIRLRQNAIITSFVSGGLAGATATTLLYPFEFVRTRLAMDRGKDQHQQQTPPQQQHNRHHHHRHYNGMIDVVKQIVKSDGFIGFYQGYGVALVGGVIYRILYLGGYDVCKAELLLYHQQRSNRNTDGTTTTVAQQQQQQQQLSWSERFIIAEIISLVAGTMIYPFDSVRRRMMMQAGIPVLQRMYRNSIHCTRHIWNVEGLRGFYLGIGPNLVRSIGSALVLVGYDGIRILL